MNASAETADGSPGPLISVIVPTHNPDPGRLRRTLAGLRAQTLAVNKWETVIVDNASSTFPDRDVLGEWAPTASRVVREPKLGLNMARRRGFSEGVGSYYVLVDDDNVLAPDYLEQVAVLFDLHPTIGALGGKNLPEFERAPESWHQEFLPLLALPDHGDQAHISQGLRPTGAGRNRYPADAAPVGAGMAIRREANAHWLRAAEGDIADRRGRELSSGGDNDIVLTAMAHGWEVGYFPGLKLTHLIPAARLETAYLARLNHGIRKSWVQVLAKHQASPWPPVRPWTVPGRKLKAWFTYRAWSGEAARIRWAGACGHFEGLVENF